MGTTENRQELLLHMYDQMWRNIDRHIIVVWQSVVVVISAVAAPLLSKAEPVNADLTTAVLIMICGWGIALALDGSYWYNRNLVIVSNIERVFLSREDLHDIHYYFEGHRRNKMIENQLIQAILSGAIGTLFLAHHFWTRVLPELSVHNRFDPLRSAPYVVALATVVLLLKFRAHIARNYGKLQKRSPGMKIETSAERSTAIV
jgi:hypothetical protein